MSGSRSLQKSLSLMRYLSTSCGCALVTMTPDMACVVPDYGLNNNDSGLEVDQSSAAPWVGRVEGSEAHRRNGIVGSEALRIVGRKKGGEKGHRRRNG